MTHDESNKKYLLQRELNIRLILKDNPLITPYEIIVSLKGDNHFALGELGGKVSGMKRTIKKLKKEH